MENIKYYTGRNTNQTNQLSSAIDAKLTDTPLPNATRKQFALNALDCTIKGSVRKPWKHQLLVQTARKITLQISQNVWHFWPI